MILCITLSNQDQLKLNKMYYIFKNSYYIKLNFT